MITYKSEREISKMRRAGEVISRAFDFCSAYIRPGVTTFAIDREVESLIRGSGGLPAFKGLYGFPATICASVNDEVIHGIPTQRVLEEGDVVKVDIGVVWDGYHADAARTFPVGKVSAEARRLLEATEHSLREASARCVAGGLLSDVSRAVESVARGAGLGIVEGWVGHGIGVRLHEEPDVPNVVSRKLLRRDLALRPGLVIAIEPIMRHGRGGVRVLPDGWTVATRDGALSAHFEDTVAVTDGGPVVLTRSRAA